VRSQLSRIWLKRPGAGHWQNVETLAARYRLVEQIAAGGMSVVWRGHDEVLGRPVAVKVLAEGYASDAAFRDRMRREARAAARLGHPHVDTVYDFGEHGDFPYMVMELIDGPSLADEMRNGPLPWRRAVGACAEIADALAAVHEVGLVHRDVKPGNVMIGPAGAKLVDFGISAEIGECHDPAPDGCVLGTPGYVAPERLTGGPALPASDVYALGLLLYKALTGHLPWDVETRTQLLRAHLLRRPAPLPRVPGMPDEVGQLIRRCLAKDPADRPGARELARAWDRAAENTSRLRTFLPVVAWEPGARRSGLATAGALAVAGAVMLAVLSGATNQTTVADFRQPDRAALVAEPACQVTYQLRSDNGQAFAGDLTLRNTGTQPLPGTTLVFAVHADQRVTGTGLTQDGTTVRVQATSLAPGAEQVLAFQGTYQGSNPMPAQFSLGDTRCEPIIVGVVAKPAPATHNDAPPATNKKHKKPKDD
jgi:eukaryotic-like serine/threonine-protein kinase